MFFKIVILLFFFLWFNFCLIGKQIQFTPDLIFKPTWKTRNLKAFQNLNGVWRTSSDEVYRVPFVEDEANILTLRKEFFLKERIKDTLYLYFGGISWEAEIYLNGKLLLIYERPFEEIVIPIPAELFNIQWNWIEVSLKKYENRTDEWWTPPFIGIHKSVFLLQRDKPQNIIQNAYIKSDSVLIYFPFSREFKYNISESMLIKDLEFMRNYGVRAIYIPYYISPRIRELLNQYNIHLVDHYEHAKQVAIYRSHSETNIFPFWFKEDNERSDFWGKYIYIGNNQLFKVASELYKPLIVILGISVLILLLIYRLANVTNYQNLWTVLPSTREIQLLIHDFQLLNSISLKYFYWVRIFIKSLIFSLFINQLYSTDNLKVLNFWHKNNSIYSFAREYGDSIVWSLGGVMVFLVGFNVIKVMIWQFAEWIYDLKDYRNKNLILEIYGEMPFLFLAYVGLLATVLIGEPLWFWLFIGCYLLMILKKQYYLIIVYNMNFKIPFSVIFFYICGFEILPWLLLI